MRPHAIHLLLGLFIVVSAPQAARAADVPPAAQSKPKVAIFPFGGDAPEKLRQQCGLSLRLKLDRTKQCEVTDGPRMEELGGMANTPLTFATAPEVVRELGALVEADVLVWGDLTRSGDQGSTTWRLKVLDLRQKDATPRELTKSLAQPTDLRFAAEEILETLPGVAAFEHPNEEAVQRDPQAERLAATGPDLVVNGDFSKGGSWEGLYQSERYPVQISDGLPSVDKIGIYRDTTQSPPNNVLVMNLSKYAAEFNGLACLSNPIKIQPNTRYRLTFRYRSDAPKLHVFVKGYTTHQDINGKPTEREVYRRQVPPTEKTDGQWVTITDEMNPQQVAFPVQTLRIDLYAYLHPGLVMFDDVTLKAVGQPTRDAKDKAIKKPVTRPRGAR